MRIRLVLAYALAALAERLMGDREDDDETVTVSDHSELEHGTWYEQQVGPALIHVDWEGDVTHIEPVTDDPAERLAVDSYLYHAKLQAAGQEVRGNG